MIITSGKGLHKVGRETWPSGGGRRVVIGGPRAHAYCSTDDLRLINVLFQPEKLRLEQTDLHSLSGYHALFTLEPAWRRRHQFKSRLHLSPPDLNAVLALVEQLENELKNRVQGFAFMATTLFMQVVGLLSRFYGRSRNPSVRHLLGLAETITRMESKPEAAIYLNDLAKSSGMSPRSFVRAFTAATGLPPIAYLIQSCASIARPPCCEPPANQSPKSPFGRVITTAIISPVILPSSSAVRRGNIGSAASSSFDTGHLSGKRMAATPDTTKRFWRMIAGKIHHKQLPDAEKLTRLPAACGGAPHKFFAGAASPATTVWCGEL